MTCHELAERLAGMQPELAPTEIARLCLLILSQHDESDDLESDEALRSAWLNVSFRMEAAADQHSAVASELEGICENGPVQFSPGQLWVLLRAVKVQSQLLELYTDQPALA